jgi:hypothetical protein
MGEWLGSVQVVVAVCVAMLWRYRLEMILSTEDISEDLKIYNPG